MIRIETRRRKTPDISIAPLVDCVFLLLIFFLLTSSFSEKRGIRIELPRSSTAQDTEQKAFEILVSHTGEITFKGKTMEVRGLTEALKTTVAEQGEKPVFMLADRLVSLEKVAAILDCVRAAKLETVSIATQRKTEGNE